MDLDLGGKGAIVTGGSRGIGRSIALALAAEGANVVISARGKEALQATEAELKSQGVQAFGIEADMRSAADTERLVGEASARLGRIDVLVNNVGGGGGGDSDEGWQNSFEASLLSAVRMTRLVVPEMRKVGGGSIVHIASISGKEAVTMGNPAYAAAKAGMISHSRLMSLKLAVENVRVNALAVGSINFPGSYWESRVRDDPEGMDSWVRQSIAFGRFGTPQEVAAVAVFLASRQASWVTGACINVDGGQTRGNT